jgi:Sulfotransferase domain
MSTAALHPSMPPKSGIVWLASFPKSGNTWTRAFLHNLAKVLSLETDSQNINELGRFSAGEPAKERFTELLGHEPTNDNLEEIAHIRHRVQEKLADEHEGLVFIKTHNALVTDRGSTTINFAVTSGAIYIVRNPLDVAISYAHHIGRSIDQAIEQMGLEGAESRVGEKQVYEVLGSWSEHVASWTQKPHPAIYVMRYEDMLADPKKTFGGLVDHLLIKARPRQIAKAIARSSFKNLQEQEKEGGFRERPEKASASFFREGRAGQWKDVLTKTQVDRIVKDHGAQMMRFGYLPESGGDNHRD